MGKRSAITRAIEYFENITPKSVEQYEAAHDAIEVLKQAKKDAARLDWLCAGEVVMKRNGKPINFLINMNRQAIDKAMKTDNRLDNKTMRSEK